MPKRSMLAAIFFYHSKTGQICPVFEWWKQNGGQIYAKTGLKPVFSIRKPDKKIVRGMTIRIPDGSVFGWLLYRLKWLAIEIQTILSYF